MNAALYTRPSRAGRGARDGWCAGMLMLATAIAAPALRADSLACGDQPADASRIVVAGGSLVEILFDLGEEQRIIAVDRTSNYPAAARDLPQIGYVRNVSAEGLLSLEPTFVLGEHDTGPPEVLEQLANLDIDFLLVPEEFSVEGIRAKIQCVAAAVGATEAGDQLAAGLLSSLEPETAQQLETAQVSPSAPAGIVLLGLREGAPVAAGADTSGQGILDMAGARNLMEFEGWKPVSVEAMAAAKPEFIVIPERGLRMAGGLDELLNHPALRFTPAAEKRRVIAMDGMAMLGFGPRTAAAAARLRAALTEDGLIASAASRIDDAPSDR